MLKVISNQGASSGLTQHWKSDLLFFVFPFSLFLTSEVT
uniref:Uncharacterized protein n=1 Tax=Rhizophora mucronata TaxID=61149 RepID=A0A2P2R036_RHIMU